MFVYMRDFVTCGMIIPGVMLMTMQVDMGAIPDVEMLDIRL